MPQHLSSQSKNSHGFWTVVKDISEWHDLYMYRCTFADCTYNFMISEVKVLLHSLLRCSCRSPISLYLVLIFLHTFWADTDMKLLAHWAVLFSTKTREKSRDSSWVICCSEQVYWAVKTITNRKLNQTFMWFRFCYLHWWHRSLVVCKDNMFSYFFWCK